MNELEEWKDGYPVITNLERWKYIYRAIHESDLTQQTQLPPVDSLTMKNNIEEYGTSTIFRHKKNRFVYISFEKASAKITITYPDEKYFMIKN